MRHIAICGLPRSTKFFNFISQTARFSGKVTEHKMCVLIFPTIFVWNISHSKKNLARCDQKCISVFMYSTGYSCQILMKLEFSRLIFGKSVQWEPSCSTWTDGRTDGNDEADSRSSHFANAPKNSTFSHTDCGSQNKQPLFPYTTLTGWFVQPRQCVFTARYGLNY